MGSITKNLDTIISQAVNGPKVDGIPLYARIDGITEQGFNGVTKSDKWIQACKTSYTSPTNIRRVFISGTKIVINTYRAPIIKGRPDTNGCWREIKLNDDTNIKKYVLQSINYQQELSKYYMEKQINPKAKEPDRVAIKGTGLKVFSNPWVLSNVEEIYFDWTLLASEDNKNSGLGCYELLMGYVQGKRGFIKSKLPLEMFLQANGGNIKDLRTRYPRLKIIGFISELGDILGADYDKGDYELKENEIWSKLEKNVELIKKSNSLIIINELDDLPTVNLEFSLRCGIYRYDNEILKPYIDSYIQSIKNKSKETKKEVEVSNERTVKSELEILLDDVTMNKGQSDAKAILMLALVGCSMDEVEKVFKEMSTEGEKKYRALLK